MCNPRRVEITLAQDFEQTWEAELSEAVTHTQDVTREVRVVHEVGSELGAPGLQALERVFARAGSGWRSVPGGYRFLVLGGYANYSASDNRLEIVASQSATISATGSATELAKGQLSVTGRMQREVIVYDDGWRGQTLDNQRAAALRDAQPEFQRMVHSGEVRAQFEQQQKEQEEIERARLREHAIADARAQIERQALSLEERAREALGTVRMRCMGAFNRALALAYREAIEAYAQANHASNWRCDDSGDTIQIEFMMER